MIPALNATLADLPLRHTAATGSIGSKSIPGCSWCGLPTYRIDMHRRGCVNCGSTSRVIWEADAWKVQRHA